MEEIIGSAIKNMNRLKIKYNGKIRIIEPHAYGLDKNKKAKLRAYQISGFSKRGESKAWKLFICENIDYILELDESFEVRPGYNPKGDSQIPKIKYKLKI